MGVPVVGLEEGLGGTGVGWRLFVSWAGFLGFVGFLGLRSAGGDDLPPPLLVWGEDPMLTVPMHAGQRDRWSTRSSRGRPSVRSVRRPPSSGWGLAFV